MAINLGDITFGLGADVGGLEKGLRALSRLERANDQLARQTDRASRIELAARVKQEQAIRRALKAVADLQAAQRRGGVDPRRIGDATRAFNALTNAMTRGTLNAKNFNRQTDAFNAKMGRLRRGLRETTSGMDKSGLKTAKFTTLVRDLESASVLAVGPLSGLGARIRAMGAIFGRSTIRLAAFLGTATALTVGLIKLTSGAIGTAREFDKISGALLAATSSMTLANNEFQFVSATSDKLGLKVRDAALQFAQFSAATRDTVLQGKATRDVFTGVATAAAALKLNTESVQGVMRALTQIVSKGVVQAEELRGQFGERVPGGFKLAAQAMGVTEKKLGELLKRGQVLASDLLPKLAKELIKTFGPAALSAVDGLTATTNRLDNAQFRFFQTVDKTLGISETYIKVLQGVTGAINSLSENLDQAVSITGALTGAMLAFAGPAILRALGALAAGIGALTARMLGLNAAILANPLGGLATILVRIATIAAGAALGFVAFRNAVASTRDPNKEFIDDVTRFIDIFKGTGAASAETTRQLIEDAQKRITASAEELKALKVVRDEVAKGLFARFTSDPAFLQFLGQITGDAPKATDLVKGFNLQIQATERSLALAQDRLQQGILAGVSQTDIEKQTKRIEEFQRTIDRLRGSKGLILFQGAQGEADQIGKLNESIDKLNKLKTRDVKTTGDLSKEVEKAAVKVRKLVGEFSALEIAQKQLALGNVDVAKSVLATEDAFDKLKKVPAAELDVIRKILKDAGIEADSVTLAYGKLIMRQKELKKAVDGTIRNLEKQPEVLSDTARAIALLDQRLTALQEGPQALKDFEKLESRTKKIERLRDALEKVGLSQQKINDLTTKYSVALEAVDKQQKIFDRQKKIAESVSKAFESSFNRIATSITDAFIKGEGSALKFRDVATAILAEVLQSLIKVFIIDKLVKGIGGVITNIGTSSSPGGTTAGNNAITSGAVAVGAKGLAIASGRVTALNKGGVLRGPTLIPLRQGAALAREAGRDEGILPLARNNSGDLGVMASGMGGGSPTVNITIINKTDSNISTQRTQGPGGNEDIRILIDKAVAQNVKSGGDTFKAIQDVFNINPRVVGR